MMDRLHTKHDFNRVLSTGVSTGNRDFLLFAAPSPDGTVSKVGIITSRKTSVRAVDRNRLKRVLREALRRDDVLALLPENYDVVIITKSQTVTLDNDRGLTGVSSSLRHGLRQLSKKLA